MPGKGNNLVLIIYMVIQISYILINVTCKRFYAYERTVHSNHRIAWGGVGVEFLVSVSDFTEMSPLFRHWNWIRSILEFAKMDRIFMIGGYN